MSEQRQWWAVTYKGFKSSIGPCSSREEAARKLLAVRSDVKEAMTGYGTDGANFDIQWVKRHA